MSDVDQFIDIIGASGGAYRFRRIACPRQLPATAGNFLFARTSGDQRHVVCCGTARSLLLAAAVWKQAIDQHQASAIYVRLNVSQAVRVQEHDDIVGRQEPIMVVAETE